MRGALPTSYPMQLLPHGINRYFKKVKKNLLNEKKKKKKLNETHSFWYEIIQ